MTSHLTPALAIALALAIQAGQATGTARPPAQGTGAANARPGTLVVTVVDEAGAALSGASVSLRGGADRRTVTGNDGIATLQSVPAGTARIRISRDGSITLEKEVTMRAAARVTTEAVLSAAPAPPPPPAPPKETPRPTPPPSPATGGPVGQPKVLSLSDLAEQMIRDQSPIVEREIGCSVSTASRLILVRDSLAAHSHADADEMIYLLAGDASLRIADKETSISAGWFGIVPRGTSHTLTKRGRNAPIILSIRSGSPCAG